MLRFEGGYFPQFFPTAEDELSPICGSQSSLKRIVNFAAVKDEKRRQRYYKNLTQDNKECIDSHRLIYCYCMLLLGTSTFIFYLQ